MRAASVAFCIGVALCVAWIFVSRPERAPKAPPPAHRTPQVDYLIWRGHVVGNPGRPMGADR